MTDRLLDSNSFGREHFVKPITPFDVRIQFLNVILEISDPNVQEDGRSLIYWLGQLQLPNLDPEGEQSMNALATRRVRNLIESGHQGIAQMALDIFDETTPNRRTST